MDKKTEAFFKRGLNKDLYSFQKKLFNKLQKHEKICFLKSRQMGFSHFFAIYAVYYAKKNPNSKVLYVCRNHFHQTYYFQKIGNLDRFFSKSYFRPILNFKNGSEVIVKTFVNLGSLEEANSYDLVLFDEIMDYPKQKEVEKIILNNKKVYFFSSFSSQVIDYWNLFKVNGYETCTYPWYFNENFSIEDYDTYTAHMSQEEIQTQLFCEFPGL